MKLNRNTIIKIIGMLVLCALIVFLVIKVIPKQSKIVDKDISKETSGVENIDDRGEDEKTIEIDTVEEEINLSINTPYCTLNYPAIWEDNLKIEKDENDKSVLTFYYYSDLHKVKMFSVYFGKPDKGTILGYLSDNEEKISFSVEVYEYETDASWTEEEKELLNSMTDGVNEIIFSVSSDDDFIEE